MVHQHKEESIKASVLATLGIGGVAPGRMTGQIFDCLPFAWTPNTRRGSLFMNKPAGMLHLLLALGSEVRKMGGFV